MSHLIALCMIALFALSGCKSSSDEVALRSLAEKDRYVLATIDIICLGHIENNPRQLHKNTQSIYTRYGFDRPLGYLHLVSSLELDQQVHDQIQQGIQRCPR